MDTVTNGAGRLARLPAGRIGKWVMVVLWFAVVAAIGPLAGKLPEATNNTQSSWLPGSAESTKVAEISERFRPSDVVPVIVVYQREGGLSQADLSAIDAQVARFGALPDLLGQVAPPEVAGGNQAAFVVIPANLGSDAWGLAPGFVDKVRAIAEGGPPYHVTGPGGAAADQSGSFGDTDSKLLLFTLLVVIVILLLTYRSPVLWLLPLAAGGVALGVAQGVIYLLAEHAGLLVNSQSSGLLIVLVFGAATDYALLLVARYREELRRHQNRHEAMAVALRRAGPAVLASAATVTIALLCLSFAQLNSTAGLGPVAAIGVAVGYLVMVTLLPALLVICGRWLFWPVRPAFGSRERSATGFWSKIGSGIARRPRVTWIGTALVLGALALGTLSLKADGLSLKGLYTSTPDSVTGAEVLATHFNGGDAQPIQVVARADKAGEVRTAFAGVPGVVSVSDPVIQDGYAYLEGITAGTPDELTTLSTVENVRAAIRQVPGADALAGGTAATFADIESANRHDRNLIIPLVLGVVFVILTLLLRALVAPLVLMATVVLSLFATLGISAFFFNEVFGFEGADASFPLFVFVFLVALGIDYNIFLMTRVHEDARRHGTRRGMLTGMSATGGVITSAGLVLAGTFAVLGALPLVFLVELGFAVAVGVLIDTIIVRVVLVTALTLDIGRFIWWPHRLSRKPDVPAEPAVEPARVPAEVRGS